MALDDLFVLDLKQDFNGQDIHNIFTYERQDSGFAVDVANAFEDALLPAINQIQCEQITNVSLRTYCLGNLASNDERVLPGGGLVVGNQMLPLHDAINFTLKSTTRAVRPGSKRFSGISETYQNNGTINNADYIADLELLRIALDTDLNDGLTEVFAPVIVKRVKYAVPDSDPVRYAYRFPEIGETPIVAQLSTVLLNLKISHQVSRK